MFPCLLPFSICDFLFPALCRCYLFCSYQLFSLYQPLAFWLTLAFIFCNFGLCCHLSLSLPFVACCSRHLLDYLPFCCPLLTSSLPLLFYLTINCVCHPLPLFLWPDLFSLLCYLYFLFVFYPTFLTFSSFYFFVLIFLCYSPSFALFCFTVCLPFLSSFILFHFLSSIFTHSVIFLFPSHSSCLWFWAVFTKHIGTWWWSMSFAMISDTSTRMHAHTHARVCVQTQTCWGWWLMNNARLSASMPIWAAQETSLGLLATAWHWLQYTPACFFLSTKNLMSWGYTLLNIDNHKK